MKNIRLVLLVLLCIGFGFTRVNAQHTFILTITDSAAIAHLDTLGPNITATFVNPTIDGIVHGQPITNFTQLLPNDNYECLRELWKVVGADSTLMNNLVAGFPALFPAYYLQREAVATSFYPDDTTSFWASLKYLDFIDAEHAWDPIVGSQGDSNVIIGVTDTYFDLGPVDRIYISSEMG